MALARCRVLLTPKGYLNQDLIIPKAMRTHDGDDPWGYTTNKGNDSRLCRRVVGFHYCIERTTEVIFSGLQSIKVVSKPSIRNQTVKIRTPVRESEALHLQVR